MNQINWQDIKIQSKSKKTTISPNCALGRKYLHEVIRKGSTNESEVYFLRHSNEILTHKEIDFSGFSDFKGELDRNPTSGRTPTIRPQSKVSITLFTDQIESLAKSKTKRSPLIQSLLDEYLKGTNA